jgi:hypothetical protein
MHWRIQMNIIADHNTFPTVFYQFSIEGDFEIILVVRIEHDESGLHHIFKYRLVLQYIA